ncbi:hypothetical protein M378DRAFT_156563 [Amanita muscaria Koide BX008]|uniref:Uncharacterized protein n=1 Tax=Amanita muscaria (strain Koide BX008) TaxID=946122 RepID=A0A0C2X7W3_AMAMK|nr:hypothetical protein M378DRAFT_156563 [Amanita muscaria Koide BX008]
MHRVVRHYICNLCICETLHCPTPLSEHIISKDVHQIRSELCNTLCEFSSLFADGYFSWR